MKIIKERLTQLDNEEFVNELFNDSNNINGNKLKQIVQSFCRDS